MKKGFTLIELLAVIVILAIIALIAVPLVLNIISDSKEKSALISVDNYLKAVENAVAKETMKNPNTNYDRKYTINSDGKVISSTEKGDIQVEYNGEGLKSGTIVIGNGKVETSGLLKVNNINIKVSKGKVSVLEKIEKNYLTTGSNFNSKIKTLVSHQETRYNTQDTKIKEIEFLGYGLIADGYTLEEFQKLERVDISEKQDETIYAIYDGIDKVYIYSESEILFNKNLSCMFERFSMIEKVNFGEYIDTSQVTNLSSMFYQCTNLLEIDINIFENSKITVVGSLFDGCENLISIKINKLNTSNVTSMESMFYKCSKLMNIDLSNFDTSQVTNMHYMFAYCNNLTELDLSNFDTSNVTNMSAMFRGCSGLTSIDVSNFNTSNVTSMEDMFYSCSDLTILDVSNFDTSKVTNMSQMFWGCYDLVTLDVSNFDTSQVKKMSYMFAYCDDLAELDVSRFETSKVTDMRYMFIRCSSLKELDVSKWDTSQVTCMESMFQQCSSLTKLDLRSWDTSKVTGMVYMFLSTTNLKPIYVGEKWVIPYSDDSSIFTGSKTASSEELCEPNSQEAWCVN